MFIKRAWVDDIQTWKLSGNGFVAFAQILFKSIKRCTDAALLKKQRAVVYTEVAKEFTMCT